LARAVHVPVTAPGLALALIRSERTESRAMSKELDTNGLRLQPDMSFEEWKGIGEQLFNIEANIQWWLGEWWLFGEKEYGHSAERANLTRYKLHTAQNAARVARSIESSRRRENLTFGHHEAVAALPHGAQDELLNQAEDEHLPVRELRERARRYRHDWRMGTVRKKATALANIGKFSILLADPPWQYDHPVQDGDVHAHYDSMSLNDICELKVPAADKAILYLWATLPKLEEAMAVINAWGFTYKTSMAWVKSRIGPGYFVRGQHEHVLVATRGKFPTPGETVRPSSVFEAPVVEHSRKPEILQELIETAYPEIPKVELFARAQRPGWVGWGDQAP
jgi:N6-adenosine-specific RNA methylase IME4